MELIEVNSIAFFTLRIFADLFVIGKRHASIFYISLKNVGCKVSEKGY
jgi:hypothetical protein